jgi:hypothetical protein
MRRTSRTRLCVESLEDRCCPSASALLTGGNLVVTGSSASLKITEVAQGQFQVLDGTANRGTFQVFGDVDVALSTPGSSSVTINLNGHTAPGNVNVQLGGTTPNLTVAGGAITGDLNVNSGGVTTVAGVVAQDLNYLGTNTGPETLTVRSTSTIHGNVQAVMGNGADTATLNGAVGGNLAVQTGAGNDQVNLGGSVAGHVIVALGTGNNGFTFSGTVGNPFTNSGSLYVTAGPGNTAVTFAGTGVVYGRLRADLGVGQDVLTVGAGFRTGFGLVDAGMGTNAMVGFFLPQVAQQSFSLVLPIL